MKQNAKSLLHWVSYILVSMMAFNSAMFVVANTQKERTGYSCSQNRAGRDGCCSSTAVLSLLNSILCVLEECCAGTFTALVDIKDTLTECCAENTGNPCVAMPIFAATTITVPGSYCLANDIVGDIVIVSDDVDLNLNNHRISGGTNGVSIDGTRIRIFNGYIHDTADQAVLVNAGSSLVTLEDLIINNAGSLFNRFAIEFNGSGGPRITNCVVQRVMISNSLSGIRALDADGIEIKDCHIADCNVDGLFRGINLDSTITAFGTRISGCSISNSSSSDNIALGIQVIRQENIVINQCSVDSITGVGAVGIEADLMIAPVISNCSVSSIRPGASDVPVTGILLFDATSAVIEQCSISETGTGDFVGSDVIGLNLNGAPGSIVDGVAVATIPQGETSIAILIGGNSEDSIIRNCSCTAVTGDSVAAGCRITGNNVVVQNCSVETVVATGESDAAAYGYDAGPISAVTGVAFVECHCANVESALNARGFNLNIVTGHVEDCDAQNVVSLSSEIPNIARGYDMPDTALGILVKNCSVILVGEAPGGEGFNVNGANCRLQDCTAMECEDTGITVFGGSATGCTVDRCCSTVNPGVGISVGGGASAVVTNCYSTQNGGADYSGVANTALIGTVYTDSSVVVGFNASE